MKIVVVIDLYDQLTNGTVMTAYRFVEELKKKGHTVRVVATGAKGEDCYEVPERYIPLATEVARLQQIRFGKPDFETLMNAFDGADVIHFYLPFKLEKKGRKIAEKMGIPCTSAFHLQPENITYNCAIKRSRLAPKILYSWFRTKFYKHFEHIHCPSKFIADQLRKNKYQAKLHVISNGVDRDFVPPDNYKELGEDINILMIGRYANEKRQDLLIKAISMSKYKDRIHLYLAGKGPNLHKLERLSKKYLKNPAVFGFYNKEELIDVIHNSDLYVHAADVEIEAIACIEAFACGVVPVISNSKKSATPQFALDERSLFEAGNAKDLCAKIDYWIEHPQEKKEMSAKYIENGEKYSIDYSIAKAEEMFKEAVADSKQKEKLNTKEARKIGKKMVKKGKTFRLTSWFAYYIIALPLLWIYVIIGYGLKVRGHKNLRKIKKTGAVSVSNHVHILDAAMNALALFPRKVAFTALKQNFQIPVAGLILRLMGAVYVPEKPSETRIFMNEVKKLLKRKRVVHIYTEAHLVNYYGGLREFKRGAFKIACDSQVPILPVVISWRKRWGLNKLILPSKPCATITIGEPIYPDYILLQRQMEQDLKERTHAAMQEIYNKSNKGKSINIFEGKAYTEYKTDNVSPAQSDMEADMESDILLDNFGTIIDDEILDIDETVTACETQTTKNEENSATAE